MDQSYKAGMATAAAAGLTLWSVPAAAAFYAGGGIGDSTIETSENLEVGSVNLDDSDFGYKLFGGFMFSEYLGEELACGIGGKYKIDNFAIRAEWDIYDAGDVDDVSMWTIGAELSF